MFDRNKVPRMVQVPKIFWRSTLWDTAERPADNTVPGARYLAPGLWPGL